MVERIDTEVLVVGAGPVGLAACVELDRFGIDYQLVEANQQRAPSSRALTVHARTLELLNMRGMAEQFIARGRIVSQAHLVLGGNRRVRLGFDELDSPFSFVLILPQTETEHLLERRLAEGGGNVQRGHTVTHVVNHSDHVTATVAGSGGAEHRIRARWLIAADGAHSTVRSLLRVPDHSEREGLTYYGGDVTVDGDATELELIWSSAGFGLLVPFADGTVRVAVSAPDAEQLPEQLALADLQAQVDRAFPRQITLLDPTWLTVLHSGHRQLAHYRCGRVLFAGDAAHTHNPAGGQGMNVGLQDAFNLGWKLAYTVKDRAPESLVDTYDAERRPAAAKVISQTENMMRLAHLRSRLLRTVRNTAARTMPRFARRRLLEQIAGLDVDYARAVTTDTPRWKARRPQPLNPGARVPDAALMTADGYPTTLHAQLRSPAHTEIRQTRGNVTFTNADQPRTLTDHRSQARRSLRLSDGDQLRVRPDGYLS